MNPLKSLIADRQAARQQEDTGADTGSLALSEDGQPSVRTLVLRDISESGVTLFINRTSPKWRIINSNPKAELLIWFHSLQRQYRLTGNLETLDPGIIQENWHRRPGSSKYLDWVYETAYAQSTEITSLGDLTHALDELKKARPEEDLQPPEGAAGIFLSASQIEILDLQSTNAVHDRKRYTLQSGQWQVSQLIP